MINTVSIKEVTQALRVSRSTVYRLIRDSKFPKPIKVGDQSRWLEDEIDAFLLQQRTTQGTSVNETG